MDKGGLTRNSEHVTRVKRHVSVAVGARTAALRVPVLPQGHRQQVRPQVVKVHQRPSSGMSEMLFGRHLVTWFFFISQWKGSLLVRYSPPS